MKNYTRRILLISVILIFLLFASYNIGVATVHYKYNSATSLNEDISEVIDLVGNNTLAVKKLEAINDEVLFINDFCFDSEGLADE